PVSGQYDSQLKTLVKFLFLPSTLMLFFPLTGIANRWAISAAQFWPYGDRLTSCFSCMPCRNNSEQ
ncbi:hypothetical protein, partial [Nitrosomonas europaea]|uniref:hypothetical protein n=1 Tax=Nitrosomonas europaea TaxID=915 RepID=UPI002C924080